MVFGQSQNSFFCKTQEIKVIEIWNNMRVSKWFKNFKFWVNYPFAQILLFFIIIIFTSFQQFSYGYIGKVC